MELLQKSSISQVKVSAATIENRPNASLIQTLSGKLPVLIFQLILDNQEPMLELC
jgi:hypothetical protein